MFSLEVALIYNYDTHQWDSHVCNLLPTLSVCLSVICLGNAREDSKIRCNRRFFFFFYVPAKVIVLLVYNSIPNCNIAWYLLLQLPVAIILLKPHVYLKHLMKNLVSSLLILIKLLSSTVCLLESWTWPLLYRVHWPWTYSSFVPLPPTIMVKCISM